MNRDKDILNEEWQDAEASIQEEGEIRSALNRMDVEAPDTEMAWKALSEQLNLEDEKPAPVRRVSMSVVLKAAISVAAAVLVAFLLVKGIGRGNMPDADAPGPLAHTAIAQSPQDSASGKSPIYNKVGDEASASASSSEGQELLSAETGRGNSKQLVLSDGTKVWLNAESTLLYPKHFSKTERRVHLSGEAYFEVMHNKKCPFIVETASLVATDLGTAFDVKAYQGKAAQLILVSGKVAVCKRGDEASPIRRDGYLGGRQHQGVGGRYLSFDTMEEWLVLFPSCPVAGGDEGDRQMVSCQCGVREQDLSQHAGSFCGGAQCYAG